MIRLRGIALLLAVAYAMASCAGKQPSQAPAPTSVFDEDDSAARPSCAPDCQSGRWVQADVRYVLHEVAKCSDELLLAPEDLHGNVTVRFENATCREAIALVAEAAGFSLEQARAYRLDDGKRYLVQATVVRPAIFHRRFVTVRALHDGYVKNTGVMVERPPDGEPYQEHVHDHDQIMRDWQSSRVVELPAAPAVPPTAPDVPDESGSTAPAVPRDKRARTKRPAARDTPIIREGRRGGGEQEAPTVYRVVW